MENQQTNIQHKKKSELERSYPCYKQNLSHSPFKTAYQLLYAPNESYKPSDCTKEEIVTKSSNHTLLLSRELSGAGGMLSAPVSISEVKE